MKKATLLHTLFIASILFIAFTSMAQFSYVGTYNWSGKPDNLLKADTDCNAAFRSKIAITLPERRSVAVYSPRLISTGRPETISLTTDAEVWITFIDEGASFRNALGYYTYPTNAPLTKAPTEKDIKIIFANASKPGSGGDLNPGSKVYLGKFPANTSIAFALIVDGWNDVSRSVVNKSGILFANAAFNPEKADALKKHTVLLNDAATQKLIIGFEDTRRDYTQCDHDFNDVLFYATVTPRNSVANNDSIPNLQNDGNLVYSGNTGGLESKSLGDIIGKRLLNKYKTTGNTAINYSLMPKLNRRNQPTTFGTNSTDISALYMAAIMPQKVYDSGYTAYITSPTDITGFTNAVEVNSIDFVKDTVCKAVAFATKTTGEVYAHTKPVCDRLRGSVILDMENFTLQNLTFVRYTLQRPNGNIEYSTSFSIGTKVGRNTFSFQSNWLTKDYINDETMYNYQLWASAPYLVTDMMLEVLNNLNAIAPIETVGTGSTLPVTYIKAAERNAGALSFTLNNNATSTNGYFEVDVKANEQADIQTLKYPFTMNADGITTVNIDVNDAYEHNVRMIVDGKTQDLLYMSDGNWSVDFDKNATTLNTFTVSNSAAATYTNELPLYRNVHIEAITASYVSIYKLLKGGGATQNLNAYKSINFTANGGNNLRITILKNSIANWNDQYTISIPLAVESKDYSINLADFKSKLNEATMDLSDVTTVIFSIEIPTGVTTAVSNSFNNIGFSTAVKTVIVNDNVSKDVNVYPNPSNGKFNYSFNSDYQTSYLLHITDISTGRVIEAKKIEAVKGNNTLFIDISSKITGTSNCILSIEDQAQNFINKGILIRK